VPVEVFNRCQVLLIRLRNIYQQINPQEKVSTELEGLLKVDIQRQLGDLGSLQGMFDQQ
jgi:hypothetical protein